MIIPKNPLTGGLMVIEIPGRKGCRLQGDDGSYYQQQKTQSLHDISDDVINSMAVKPLSDEVSYTGDGKRIIKLKHSFQKRLQYWLNDHFLALIGGMNYHPQVCAWKFNHNQY